ncbi:cytochrome-c peroxidase [Vibrio paucivorans]|uniref:Cytochrome B6 n=1 Tax=Vibrio paucivorans TaxID=2829489 RepID=A0A9X3HQH3_9VIBR|nr:cytochrome c peroxidase [Vibrio paucivorans]MCW8333460.1 cytochrome B6 [Vibrio paucivorans]
MNKKGWLIAISTMSGIAICVSVAITLLPGKDHTHEIPGHADHHGESAHHNHAHDLNIEPTREVISPIPDSIEIDKPLAKLGWILFKDPKLSSNNRVSCETCHSLTTNGAEPHATSTGVRGTGTRNSLTVFNAALNYRFFWDGRVNNLHEQIDGPIHNSLEMNSNWRTIEKYISESPRYSTLFSQLNLEISEQSIKSALVEFMSALVTPNSAFDQYLKGDAQALTQQQLRGWEAFQAQGCIRCHRGTNVGGGMVMRFGFFGEHTKGEERTIDTGRYLVTSRPEDMFLFRVASLRNVVDTPPYFHDGNTQSLEEAIRIMGRSQLGVTLADNTVNDISAFLSSLSGERPAILEEFSNDPY